MVVSSVCAAPHTCSKEEEQSENDLNISAEVQNSVCFHVTACCGKGLKGL